MSAHAIVQTRAAGQKTFGLRIVCAVDQTHELARDIAMEPWRTKCVLHRQDARREDDKIERVHPRRIGDRLQHQKNRRVRMVVADRSHRIESPQVVLVRCVVAVPGDDVERRVVDFRGPETPAELRNELKATASIFVGGVRCLKITRIGEAVRSDRTEIRKTKQRAVVFAHVTAGFGLEKVDAKANAPWDHDDFVRLGLDHAELRRDAQAALLQYDQHLAIGAVEVAIDHRTIGGVHMDRTPGLRAGITVARHRDESLKEICRHFGKRQRIPSELIGRRLHFVESMDNASVIDAAERTVNSGRSNAIEPRAPVHTTRRRECRARELLRIQSVWRSLGRVLPARQSAGQRFGREFVAETGLITKRLVATVRRNVLDRAFARSGFHRPSRSHVETTRSRAADIASRSTAASPM